ncbi:ABC transporter permease [Pengzhenrongella frigida]|uniref:ABC transporter permease n=1 Tax=Pengzhenrongella frigida TaxID=1259133 RepID=A0A4Q5MX28_9MICO|nr:ABC transporter permease [Cellulomonas sp. HLT2-17]RYV50159.1 ABC transporter permease [Cellulomonas sp. HLT2-17]
MTAALRTEYRKLVTTRLWWILLASMAAYMAFLAGIMAFALTQDPGSMTGGAPGVEAAPMTPESVARTIYTLATSLGYVFPVIVGALAMTSEFRHQTITPTLLAEPRRTVFLAAKMLSSVVVGLLFGIVGTVSTVGAGAGVLALMGEPTYLSDPIVVRSAWLSVVALTVWTVVGVGFGTLLTNQVAVIVVVLAFTQFVEPILRIAGGQFDWSEGMSKYLPGAAGEAITGSSFYADSGMAAGLLTSWQGFAVLLGYAVLFAVVGRVTTLRRDIT